MFTELILFTISLHIILHDVCDFHMKHFKFETNTEKNGGKSQMKLGLRNPCCRVYCLVVEMCHNFFNY